MAIRRPLVWVNGRKVEIATGDTIDPAVLPASGSGSDTFAYFVAG